MIKRHKFFGPCISSLNFFPFSFYKSFLIIVNHTMSQDNPLILIYYKFRGQLQPIRNLLCYLQFIEEQKSLLTAHVKEQLKNAKIDKNRLPVLVFQGYTAYQPYPILAFICRRFQRDDLLGTNPQEKARLEELLEIYFMKQPQCMNELCRLSDMAASTNPQLMQVQLRKSFENVMNRSGYIRQICEHLDCQLNPKYILANRITIGDFIFLESCNYTLGLFNECDKYQYQCKDAITECKEPYSYPEEPERPGKKPNPYYLRILREYKQRMQGHQFYHKYSKFLEGFSIISVFTSPQRAEGLRKIWLLNDFFVK